jgi:hypothetical protein
MTAFRLTASILFGIALAVPANAQVTTKYRTAVPAGEAAPTNGSFSIRFPVAFDDSELSVQDLKGPTLVTRILTGQSSEGLRFSATQMTYVTSDPPPAPEPLDSFMQAAGRRSGAGIADVHREQKDGAEILSFLLTQPSGSSYFRLVRAKGTQYMQVVQFPNAQRDKAASMKDAFFDSFRITR